jgi:hypothetical protein
MSLDAHPDITCHGDLLHPRDGVRQSEHSSYMFHPESIALSFDPGRISADQFFNRVFCDTPSAAAVGIRLPYERILKYDLWTYIDAKAREGDFCLVHVQRNPVICYVRVAKERQAKTNGRQAHHGLYVDAAEFCDSVRKRLSIEAKLNRICRHRVVVEHDELRAQTGQVVEQICSYFGIRFSTACIPQTAPTPRPVRSLVANWDQLYGEAPADIRQLMAAVPC